MTQINNIKEPPIFDQTIKSFIYWKQCMENYMNSFGIWDITDVTLNIFFWFGDLQNNLEFYNLSCLNFVQWLKYKWISAQEPRLMMEYNDLIETALGLGLVRPKLGWIG
jgi:hypothetical protein